MKKQGDIVIHRSKHDKKDISKEPETKELKRMIRDGELDPDRTAEHLEREDDIQHEPDSNDTKDLGMRLIMAESKMGEMCADIPDKKASSGKGTRSLPPGVTKKASHKAQEIMRYPEAIEIVREKAENRE